MKKLLLGTMVACIFSLSTASASEYCYSRYDKSIKSANAEIGDNLDRLTIIDEELSKKEKRKSDAASEIANIASQNPSSPKIQQLANEIRELDKSIASLSKEGFDLQDRNTKLKGEIPANLAGELRGCVEATRPANTVVNLTIQSLAILSTGGASLLLPPKTLYVDMSAVLNGYPLGGPQSVVNKTRNDVAKALGVDLEKDNGFIGNVIKDPLKPWTW